MRWITCYRVFFKLNEIENDVCVGVYLSKDFAQHARKSINPTTPSYIVQDSFYLGDAAAMLSFYGQITEGLLRKQEYICGVNFFNN